MDKKIAILAGATGLVGEQLLKQLLENTDYSKVIAVVRKTSDIKNEKLEQRVTDFEKLPEALADIKADEGFCCLGTTIKAAGTKERQYRIDHDYVVEFARACFNCGVSRFAVVSSIGAKASSSNFYLRTKGEMEDDLKKIPFESLYILQPSLLLGERKEFRAGEKAGIAVMKFLNPLLAGGLRKYRGVEAAGVARSMVVEMSKRVKGVKTIRSDEIK
jgi:uncharacterized protein YbjT (DUF2867 family)